MTTKLWNNNHRPERVKPARMASLHKLGLDEVDLYLVHTPFAFAPGDDQDRRHPHGPVVYDDGVKLQETWAAMESLVDAGLSRAIGLSDIDVEGTRQIVFCSEAGLASPFMRERDRTHNDSWVIWEPAEGDSPLNNATLLRCL